MSSEVQQQRNESRNWNVDLLLDSGLVRVPRSNLFEHPGGFWVLSPGISAGVHGRRLFDVRDANLEKIDDPSRAALLLRFIPSGFAFLPLSDISMHLSPASATHGAKSGVLYRFACDLDIDGGAVTVQSVSNKAAFLRLRLLNREAAAQSLSAFVDQAI